MILGCNIFLNVIYSVNHASLTLTMLLSWFQVLEQQSVTLQQRLKKSEPAVENVAASTSKQSASQQSCFNSSEALSTKEKWLSGSEPFPQIFLPEEEVKRSLEKDDSLTEHNVEVT